MAMFARYAKIKASYPDALILMRVGDFYEAFDGDADSLARSLGLARTMRADHRMAGFPHMQLERFLPVLIGAGLRVAVVDLGDTPKVLDVAGRAKAPGGTADA
jgi:DNA mismatch repair protein MutS